VKGGWRNNRRLNAGSLLIELELNDSIEYLLADGNSLPIFAKKLNRYRAVFTGYIYAKT